MTCGGSFCGAWTLASADPLDVAVARESASDMVSPIAATAHTTRKSACLTGIALLLTRVEGAPRWRRLRPTGTVRRTMSVGPSLIIMKTNISEDARTFYPTEVAFQRDRGRLSVPIRRYDRLLPQLRLSGAGVLEPTLSRRGMSQRRGPAKSRSKVVITVLDNVRGGAPRRGRTRISGGFNARLVGGEPTWPRQRADTKLPSTVACRADTWLQDGFPPNLSWSSPHRCQARPRLFVRVYDDRYQRPRW